MVVLSDYGIKEPFFDPPEASEPGNLPICDGSRVALFCEGLQINVQVTSIQRLGTVFVGRVLNFTPKDAVPESLATGDFIRFRPRDVHWIE